MTGFGFLHSWVWPGGVPLVLWCSWPSVASLNSACCPGGLGMLGRTVRLGLTHTVGPGYCALQILPKGLLPV